MVSPVLARVVVALSDASLVMDTVGAAVSTVTALARVAVVLFPAASWDVMLTALPAVSSPACTTYVAV